MSEPTKPTDIVEVKCLEEGTTITIDVPSELHNRLRHHLYNDIKLPEGMNMAKFLEEVLKNDPNNPSIYHARSLLWLIAEIEGKAAEQKKIVMIKVDKTTGKQIPD